MTTNHTASSQRPAVRFQLLACLLATVFSPSVVAAQPAAALDHIDPATGYRIAQYRAPTPPSVPGGMPVTLETLQALVRDQRAILLDVTPSEGAGADPVTGIWHLPKSRQNMPGTVWLPDVGKGVLTPPP